MLKQQSDSWQLVWPDASRPVFTDGVAVVTAQQWQQQLQAVKRFIAMQPGDTVLLYQADPVLFSVWFIALSQLGKHIVLSPDGQPDTQGLAARMKDFTRKALEFDGTFDTKSKSLQELKGKAVAVNEGSTSQFWLSYLLKKNGMSMSDITVQNMTADDAATAAVPIMPPAPGRLSTSTFWPRRSASTGLGRLRSIPNTSCLTPARCRSIRSCTRLNWSARRMPIRHRKRLTDSTGGRPSTGEIRLVGAPIRWYCSPMPRSMPARMAAG